MGGPRAGGGGRIAVEKRTSRSMTVSGLVQSAVNHKFKEYEDTSCISRKWRGENSSCPQLSIRDTRYGWCFLGSLTILPIIEKSE